MNAITRRLCSVSSSAADAIIAARICGWNKSRYAATSPRSRRPSRSLISRWLRSDLKARANAHRSSWVQSLSAVSSARAMCSRTAAALGANTDFAGASSSNSGVVAHASMGELVNLLSRTTVFLNVRRSDISSRCVCGSSSTTDHRTSTKITKYVAHTMLKT